jgi:methionyl-tRNA formyltransferase
MDTGPILQRREIEIGAGETAPELSARMSEIGAGLIVESLLRFDRGEISPIPQAHERASYAPILKKEDGRIEWSRSAHQIYNRMRGFAPWPGAYSTFRGQICQLWGRPESRAAAEGGIQPGDIASSTKDVYVVCGEGTCMLLESVQLEGRKRISAREFANGARLVPTDNFV